MTLCFLCVRVWADYFIDVCFAVKSDKLSIVRCGRDERMHEDVRPFCLRSLVEQRIVSSSSGDMNRLMREDVMSIYFQIYSQISINTFFFRPLRLQIQRMSQRIKDQSLTADEKDRAISQQKKLQDTIVKSELFKHPTLWAEKEKQVIHMTNVVCTTLSSALNIMV